MQASSRPFPPHVSPRTCDAPRRYVLHEGEGHGFVKESSVVDSVQQELKFYSEALGFEPAL